jgi:hypothetical protein
MIFYNISQNLKLKYNLSRGKQKRQQTKIVGGVNWTNDADIIILFHKISQT